MSKHYLNKSHKTMWLRCLSYMRQYYCLAAVSANAVYDRVDSMNQNTILDGLINFVHTQVISVDAHKHSPQTAANWKPLEFANETDNGRDWAKNSVGLHNKFDTLHFGCSLTILFLPGIRLGRLLVSVMICEFFAFCENLSKHFERVVKVQTHSVFWQIYISTVQNGSMCCNQHQFMWLWPV